jgi:hemolysin activation/secretion protein
VRPRTELLLLLLLLAPLARAEGELPPVDARAPEDARLSAGLSVLVREFRVRGSTVFTPEQVAPVLAPYVGRRVDSEELLRARDALTQLYLDHGYLGSGAVLPDQRVQDGVVELQVIEGRLGEIEVRGANRLRAARLRERVRLPADRPFRIAALEERLQRLQRDPLIRRVDARLSPGARAGESMLDLAIEEEQPWFMAGQLANDVASSLGGQRAQFELGHRSLTGRGDSLAASLSMAEGLSDLELRYALPLGRRDTRLELGLRRSLGEVVRGAFEDAVDSERTSWGAMLVQPLLDTANDELELGIGGELRRGEVELFGEPIALFGAESDDAESRVSVLRAYQSWVHRTPDQVLALRLTGSLGVDRFDASRRSTPLPNAGAPGSAEPDGRFFAWLAQLRYARHLPGALGLQLVARADVQLTHDALLPLERFSVGGSDTVRGYPENQMVRDNAAVASLELRIPVLRDALDRSVLELAPFFDLGRAWNRERTESLRTISSAGLGIRYAPRERLRFEIYWGARLRDVETVDAENLQDHGIHARVLLTTF